MIVITLVLVLLMPDGSVMTQARGMDSIDECKAHETAAHEAVQNSGDVIDVGTICLESKFDPLFKPHA